MKPPKSNPAPDCATDRFLDSLRLRWRDEGGTPSVLAALIKTDLQRRYQQGERPAVAGYLQALPELCDHSDQVLSLIYEEFCLREEAGESPDPDSFCDRYSPWRDSLASQLNYHRVLSQAAGGLPRTPTVFPEPGDHFLRFRLRSILGQGGAARVFLADDEDLGGRLSALKVSPDRGEEPSIMGRLQHRYIMPVLTVVKDPETGLRGLCMPYRPGRPLDQILRRLDAIPPEKRSPLTLLEAASPEDRSAAPNGPGWDDFPRDRPYPVACAWISLALAEALDHAHERGILHRDVKPANVLLSASDGPQLLDFNLAHDPNAPERAESALRGGTLPYMAPEQLEAFLDPDRWGQVGPTADLYALGLVLRELLTGERPETPPVDTPLPRTINDLLILRATGWPSTRVDNPATPHALDAIIGRCLAFDPADRYPSAAVLAEDLRAFLDRKPLVLAVNPNRRERASNWARRNRVAIAVLSLALLMVPGGLALRGSPPELAELIGSASFLHEKSRSPAFGEADRAQFRDDARQIYMGVIRREPNAFRAYHGLALIALDEGEQALHDQLIDRAILAYESSAEDRDDGEPGSTNFRSYISQIYLKKVLGPLGEWKSLLANGRDNTPETSAIADQLRSMLPSLQVALEYGEECEGPLKLKIHLAAAASYSLLADHARTPDEYLKYRSLLNTSIEQINRLNASGIMPDSTSQDDLRFLEEFPVQVGE